MTFSNGNLARWIAVIAFLLLAYTWAGYPVLLWVLRRFFAREITRAPQAVAPKVSIIIAVRNEQHNIAARLIDCTNLEYPADRLEIVIVSDNSTDKTEEIVKEFAERDPRIRLLVASGQSGKSAAQNLGMEHARGDILFFTDADTRTRPDTLAVLMENFADPNVGLVTANVYLGQPGNAVAEGQGMYWRFELFLRKLESELGILATGSGQLLLYLGAWIGWWRARKGEPAWVFAYPFAFCLANIGFLLGMVKVMRRQKITSY